MRQTVLTLLFHLSEIPFTQLTLINVDNLENIMKFAPVGFRITQTGFAFALHPSSSP